MRVLLVEDSERLRRSVSAGLQKAGYQVDVAANGTDGLWHARSHDYHVIVLDLMLPGIDGLSLLRTLRSEGKTTHVLILTARDTVSDRVGGLRTGADDYLVKPFAFDELLARIEALGRRTRDGRSPPLKFGQLQLDRIAKRVTRGGTIVELAPREYALLEFLSLRAGQVVSRAEIESHLYDDHTDLTSNVVDAAVCALRRKLDQPGEASLIQTRRGMGYQFDPDREPSEP